METIAQVLEYSAGFQWSVKAGADDVVATLTGPADGPDAVTLAETTDSRFRTVLRIPLARNRAQLGLLYIAFLGRSVTRVRSSSDALIPGESGEWGFDWRHIDKGLTVLEDEGLLDWDKSERAFVFDAGPAGAFLRFERLENFRSYGGTALRLTATVPGMDFSALRAGHLWDADVLGSWNHGLSGLSYSVTIPPATMFFGSAFIAEELVTWVGRHIVTHVRKAF
jgi:hypothetical protein